MAIPTYVGAGVGKASIDPVTNVGWPTSHQADDIGVLVIETANEVVATPSGWTALASSPQGTGTAGVAGATRLSVFWKRATSTAEPAVDIGDAGNHQLARIYAFRGCEASTSPIDVTAGDVQAGSDTTVEVPSVTTTVADCLILLIASNASDNTASEFTAPTNAALANVTARSGTNSTVGVGGGYYLATGEKAVAGATGASAITLATASAQARIAVALKPPSAGTAAFGGIYIATGEKVAAGAIGASTGTLYAAAVQAKMTIALKPPTPAVNTAPTLDLIPPLFATVDDELDYPLVATDPEGNAITFSVFPGTTAVPDGLTLDADSGVLQWTPLPVHEGVWNVVFRATDSGGLFDEQSVTLTVTGPGPTIISAYSGGLVSIT